MAEVIKIVGRTSKISAKDRIYEGVLEHILNGDYPANTIINEKDLIEKYSASKTTVREALVKLCSEGVLKNIPRYGYFLEMIQPIQLRELVEFRKTIEIAALEASFLRIGRKEIQQLSDLNQEIIRYQDDMDVKKHWVFNNQFHQLLCSYSNNSFYIKALSDAMIFSIRASNQYYSNIWSQQKKSDSRNHIRLIDALREGSLDKAKKILREDIEEYIQEIIV